MNYENDLTLSAELETFDLLFIGLGASNSLILLELIKNELIQDKKVLIIESDNKSINDKTYCFWASKDDSIIKDLSAIISFQFEMIKVNDSMTQNIKDQPYFYIRSIDLYNHTLKIINNENISVERDLVKNISPVKDYYSVTTNYKTFKSSFIFDSRPPSLKRIGEDDIHISQSFFGLHIKCENESFEENAFEMMNFNVEQNGATQFLYIIPFSSHEALIELTRFGKEKLDLIYAADLLENWILNHFGKYTVLADESGCIPMTTFLNEPSEHSGIIQTGTSANLIKPSTGYGFKNMYLFARSIGELIKKDEFQDLHCVKLKTKKRFRFYDTLLLIILLKWSMKGKEIFSQLYRKQKTTLIFKFLDEKTTLYEEFKIFVSLPFSPFLKALYSYLKTKIDLRYRLAFFFVFLYLLISVFNPNAAKILSYIVLSIGLIGFGIPHGAIDHLLVKKDEFSLPAFIFKYCISILLFYVLWQFIPVLALVIFILYSSLHFGESELVRMNRNNGHNPSVVKSFLLGLCILIFITSTHAHESILIITQMNIYLDLSALNTENVFPILSILSFIYILIQNFLSREHTHTALLFLLAASTLTPLITAFGLYFIFQHSFNAWNHLKQGLKMDSIDLYRKSFLFNAGALLIMGFILFQFGGLDFKSSFWSKFFIFIACISFPHFILMHLFYRKYLQS